MALVNFGRGTLSAIQSTSKSADVLYFATDAQALYLGDHLVTSNISDAAFANNVLTINKLDGSKISLDFSDVASAEGVNSLLATLRSSINENAAAIADVSSHLAEVESQVTANKVSAADKSINVTGSTIKVNVSSTAGNQLALDANGLYVAKEEAYTGVNAISISDHEISLVLDGASLSQSAAGLKSTLKLAKMTDAGEGNASGYQLVDSEGNVYGDAITIAADQFLKDVELDTADNLVFTFTTSTGEKTEKVNISKYIDTYTAGNGINITDKKVSVVVKSGDKYLEVTADGVASKGIDSAISTAKTEAVNEANTYTDGSIGAVRDELADAVVALEAADASNLSEAKSYTDAEVKDLSTYVDSRDAATLASAKTDASTKAAAAEDAAKSYTDSSVSALKTYVNTQDTSILNTAKADATSKADAAEDAAKAYADSSIAAAVSSLEEKIKEVQSNVDSVVVYKADDTTITQTGTDTVTFSVKSGIYDAAGAAASAQSAAITHADNAVKDLSTYVDTQDAATLASAKSYADGSINSVKTIISDVSSRLASQSTDLKSYIDTQDTSILNAAKNDASTKANTALSSAKAYTDTEVKDLSTYVDTQDTSILSAAKADATSKANTAKSEAITEAKSYTDTALSWIEIN